MIYDEIYEVARDSELNREQREHSFHYWRKSTILDELLHDFSGGDVYPCQAYDRILFTTEQLSELLKCYHID